MIRLRYDLVRWVIAVLSLILITLGILARPIGGASIFFVLFALASAGAIVYPPGLYFWLFNSLLLVPVCPNCRKQVAWSMRQGSQNPYWERLVVFCPGCDKERIEFNFDPT